MEKPRWNSGLPSWKGQVEGRREERTFRLGRREGGRSDAGGEGGASEKPGSDQRGAGQRACRGREAGGWVGPRRSRSRRRVGGAENDPTPNHHAHTKPRPDHPSGGGATIDHAPATRLWGIRPRSRGGCGCASRRLRRVSERASEGASPRPSRFGPGFLGACAWVGRPLP